MNNRYIYSYKNEQYVVFSKKENKLTFHVINFIEKSRMKYEIILTEDDMYKIKNIRTAPIRYIYALSDSEITLEHNLSSAIDIRICKGLVVHQFTVPNEFWQELVNLL